jgi:hypothetical protein
LFYINRLAVAVTEIVTNSTTEISTVKLLCGICVTTVAVTQIVTNSITGIGTVKLCVVFLLHLQTDCRCNIDCDKQHNRNKYCSH